MDDNKEKALISVIVPVYNVEKYVEKCIASILKQTYENLEIILVNDGSTDNSLEICEKFKLQDSRVVIVNKKNGGLSDARNAGLEIAKGDYIGFVDADDWIAEDMYQRLIEACHICDADMAACKMIVVSSEEEQHSFLNEKGYICLSQYEAMKAQIEKNEETDINVSVCCKLFKKEIIGNLRFEKGVHYEDIMFSILVLSRVQNCAYDSQKLYYYRQNRKDSITQNWLTQRVFTDWIPILKQRIIFLQNIGYEDISIIDQFYFLCHLIDVYFAIYENEKKELYPNAVRIGASLFHNKLILMMLRSNQIGCNHKYYRTYKLKMMTAFFSPRMMYLMFHLIHKIRKCES